MSGSIDLNADLGEGMPHDQALMALISSASIACGGHAGDTTTMRDSILRARDHNVHIGAHPGFADPDHFGRRRLDLSAAEIEELTFSQVSSLAIIAASENCEIAYVKLHGALANMAAEDIGIAKAAFSGALKAQSNLAILALDNSMQVSAAQELGAPIIREAYADRAYLASGLLVPRSTQGSVINDPALAAEQVIRLALAGEIVAIDGTIIASNARSICIHGDTPQALLHAQHLVEAIHAAGLQIAAS